MDNGKNPDRLRALGVIPARGGSKSIPNKNIVDLNGKPLIAYAIDGAKNSDLLDDFIVSTDSEEIASIASAYGANAPFIRPADLSTDNADSLGVILHALQFMETQGGEPYDAVVMLQPTTPFRKASWIDEALRRLDESNLDSIVSVVDVGANHPYRMYSLNKNDELVAFVDGVDDPMMPRQKLPPVYIRSGDIYVTRRSCLVEQMSLIGTKSGGLIVDPEFAVNIDEPIDLEIARSQIHIFNDASYT